jgi:methionyl-tRNA formyltransferase
LKIIFAGTPEFAVPTLQALLNSEYHVVAVYTQPDRPAGRGQRLTASPVKQLAATANIPIYQPTTLRGSSEQQVLRNLNADLMVVVAYGLILPKAVLEMPRLGCINVHASLLPRWRGAAPMQRAILAGDKETGITIMQMDEGLDTGEMLRRVSCPIDLVDTTHKLHDRLAALGANVLLETLENLQRNILKSEIQDEQQACYAKKIDKAEAQLDWQQGAEQLDRMVRAFNPWPIAYTFCRDELVRVWQTSFFTRVVNAVPGTIVAADKNGIDVATGSGILRLLKIQLPGSRCLPVSDVLNAKAGLFSLGTRLGK